MVQGCQCSVSIYLFIPRPTPPPSLHTINTQLEELPPESWLSIFLGSFNDATLIVLIVSAVVSLAIGTYEVSGMDLVGRRLLCFVS